MRFMTHLIIMLFFAGTTINAETIDGWTVSEKGDGWNVTEEKRPAGMGGWYNFEKTWHSPRSVSISFPGDEESNAGDYAALTKSFKIADFLSSEAKTCYLSFWVKDSFSGATYGYHKIQALVNDTTILYSEDVASNGSAWHHVNLDVGKYTIRAEQNSISITFRIYEEAGVTNFPVEVYFDNIIFTFDEAANKLERLEKLSNVKMTYDGMGNGRFDDRYLSQIVNLVDGCNSNIYAFLFYNEDKDYNYGNRWEIYQEAALDSFKVNSHGAFDSWAYLVPPSEFAPQKYPEPYRDDYNTWFQEFAGLSIEQTNLTGIAMDDFDSAFWYHESDKLSVKNVKSYIDSLRMINPLIPFVAVSYYDQKLDFIAGTGANYPRYKPYIDAILFPYGYVNPSLITDTFKPQVDVIRKNIGKDTVLLTDVYASGFKDFVPTPEWIMDVGTKGKEFTDGLGIYTLQTGHDPVTKKKIEAIRILFSDDYPDK